MKRIDTSQLRPGDILHARDTSWLGRRIQRVLGSWGNHDALVVPDYDHIASTGKLAIGESVPPRAKLTPITEFDRRLNAGTHELQFFRPADASAYRGEQAAQWWMRWVYGRAYDWGAYPRLLLKSLLGDWFPGAAGWEWAWYCTEGVATAWKKMGVDVYAKTNPTPKTTEKRVGHTLVEIHHVVVEEP